MMMNSISRRIWLAGAVVLCVSAATVWAETIYRDQEVPSVNSRGYLDRDFGDTIPLKINLNTTKRTFTASGKGQVANQLIGKKGKPESLTFENPPITVNVPSGAYVESILYKVAKDGKRALKASGVYEPL